MYRPLASSSDRLGLGAMISSALLECNWFECNSTEPLTLNNITHSLLQLHFMDNEFTGGTLGWESRGLQYTKVFREYFPLELHNCVTSLWVSHLVHWYCPSAKPRQTAAPSASAPQQLLIESVTRFSGRSKQVAVIPLPAQIASCCCVRLWLAGCLVTFRLSIRRVEEEDARSKLRWSLRVSSRIALSRPNLFPLNGPRALLFFSTSWVELSCWVAVRKPAVITLTQWTE